jgi:hypothetical protein
MPLYITFGLVHRIFREELVIIESCLAPHQVRSHHLYLKFDERVLINRTDQILIEAISNKSLL